MHGAVLDSSPIITGINLHALMACTIARRRADGWEAEGDGAYGFVFVRKAGDGRMVAIVQVDPAEPTAGAYPTQPVLEPARVSP